MSLDKSQVMNKHDFDKTIVTVSNEVIQRQGVITTSATTQKNVSDQAFSAKPTVGELIEFQATGLLVVFVVLGGITLLCSLMAKLLAAIAPDQFYGKKRPAPAQSVESTPYKTPSAAGVSIEASVHPGLSDDKLLAILATTAQDVLGHSASVVSIRPVGAMS